MEPAKAKRDMDDGHSDPYAALCFAGANTNKPQSCYFQHKGHD